MLFWLFLVVLRVVCLGSCLFVLVVVVGVGYLFVSCFWAGWLVGGESVLFVGCVVILVWFCLVWFCLFLVCLVWRGF